MLKIISLIKISVFIIAHQWMFAQNEGHQLVQLSLDNPRFVNHILKQSLIDINRPLSIVYNDGYQDSLDFKFVDEILVPFELLSDEVKKLDQWNFNVINVEIFEENAEVIYEFYPYWKKCDEETSFLEYSTGIYFTVHDYYAKEGDLWKIVTSKITDIIFEDWMMQAGFSCIIKNYVKF